MTTELMPAYRQTGSLKNDISSMSEFDPSPFLAFTSFKGGFLKILNR